MDIKKIEKELQEKYKFTLQKMKHYSSIVKLIKIGGICADTIFVMQEIEFIQKYLNNGASYNDAFAHFAYYDCFTGNLALLIIAEEKFNTKINSAEQWQVLAQINSEYRDWIKSSFIVALEARYHMALNKILKTGGNYQNLLSLEPCHFGLPESWESIFKIPMTKSDMINQVLFSYIEQFFLTHALKHPTLRDVAEKLKAPFKAIIAAVQTYD